MIRCGKGPSWVLVAALAGMALAGCGSQGGTSDPAAEAGKDLFTSQGCGGCHALEAAGTTGTVGPDLSQALAGRSPAFIRESIVEPGARVAPGFPDDVMPADYGSRLSSEDLGALVDYLARTAGR